MLDHPSSSTTLRSIADTYMEMNQIREGLAFCQEKLLVQKNTFVENHPCIARTLSIIAHVFKDRTFDDALRYYTEALSILRKSTFLDSQTIAYCLTEISRPYHPNCMKMMSYEITSKHFILNEESSPDHIEIANILH